MKSVLETRGIDSLVKNEFLAGGVGELPPTECWPEVWVLDDEFYDKAKAIVDALLVSREAENDWCCGQCGEQLEAQFSECWNCGQTRADLD